MSATNRVGLGIYVTSAGRADKLHVLKYLNTYVQALTTFVVPYDQYDQYVEALKHTDCKVIAPPPDIMLMSPKRQWAIENAPERYFCMMDDDLDFFKRTDEMKLVKATPDEVQDMFDMMEEALDTGIKFVGISPRFGNNLVTSDYKDIGRVSRCWAFDIETYLSLGVNVSPFPTYCIDDFHVILSFLEKGYANRVFYNYSQDDKGSNSEGGCSVYRDFEVQRQSALWLAQAHPGMVEVVEKETKVAWPGMKKTADGKNVRHDVKVSWQKAYQRGRAGGGMTAFLASQKAKG